MLLLEKTLSIFNHWSVITGITGRFRMKKSLVCLAVAGVFGLTAFSASADDASADGAYDGAWYGLAGVGDMFHTDKDLKAKDNNLSGFLRLGKEISEHWDVQLGLSHSQADEDSNAYTSGKYKQTLFGVDALYVFSRDKFRPFLLAGLGGARNTIGYNGTPDANGGKTSWMGNVGLGFQYLFTDNVGLQADYRHVWSQAEATNLFGGTGGHETQTIGNDYLNLGILIRFPAPKKVAAAPEPTPMPVIEPTPEPTPEPMAAPEPAPAPEPVGPAAPAFEKITLASEVLFAFDKDVLKQEGKERLDADVVGKMKAHPEVELLLITGHTDLIGSDGYNQKLSERRANAVKSYLVSQGIEENRLHAIGKGEKEPVVDCKGVRGKKLIQCLQPNRRVVVEIEVQREN
jgi:OOP family OmpA-OmpF porin